MQKSKESGKKVAHVFRDKLLPVDTCRSVFSSTAGVSGGVLFWQEKNTRKRTPDRRLAALSLSCDIVVIAQTAIPFSTRKSSFWEIRNLTEWIGGKVVPFWYP